ncbi:MAG: hypothetical protein JRE14_08270 [Deltaproteobacteria bacterium]|nr:hypothetical protein [Deltaproteobacteria bacterium]
MGIYAVAAAVLFTAAGILGDAFFFDFTTALPMLPPVVGSGLLPVIIFTGAAAVFLMALKRRFSADSNEAVQSLYIFLMVMYVVLTITCLWFRGTDMALAWPWGK